MIGKNLSTSGKVTRVSNAVAAGTDAINSTAVDMQGFEAVTFLVPFGAITAGGVQSVKAQQSSDNGSSDAFADLAGTSVTVADDDDNGVVVLEVHNPVERYVRCVVSRATQNSTVDGIIAIQTGANVEPVTHDSTTVVASELHRAPAAGTA